MRLLDLVSLQLSGHPWARAAAAFWKQQFAYTTYAKNAKVFPAQQYRHTGELDAAGRACVVFASMPDTEGLERALAAATRDCAVVLPVRACGKGTGSWCDGAAPHNLALLDPHPLWRVAARAAVGRAATVLHYWSPEDRLALGGPHDADWEVNAAADGGATSHPDPESALRRVDAALLHMLFGKRTACDDGDRARLFSRVVSNLPALCPRLERVVVSEFVADALAPTNPARACLPSPDDLADLVLADWSPLNHHLYCLTSDSRVAIKPVLLVANRLRADAEQAGVGNAGAVPVLLPEIWTRVISFIVCRQLRADAEDCPEDSDAGDEDVEFDDEDDDEEVDEDEEFDDEDDEDDEDEDDEDDVVSLHDIPRVRMGHPNDDDEDDD